MRYWSGAQVAYVSDDDGAAVMIFGPLEGRVQVPQNIWTLDIEKEDGRRFWSPTTAQEITRIHNPVDNAILDILIDVVDTMTTSQLHPALENGLKSEVRRLLPEIPKADEANFGEFVEYLDKEFGFNVDTWADDPLVKVVDGIGPAMITVLDGQVVVLPELSPAYQAPAAWRQAIWWVNNHMFGPLMDENSPPEQQLTYANMQRTEESHTSTMEGLIYYQSALMIIAWAAWSDETDLTYFNGFIDLIMSGQRYWQQVP